MLTKTIVEGLLYVSGNNPIVKECLEVCHVIDRDRNWTTKPHVELYYLDAFKRPKFLVVIDKQLHVYIIGDNHSKQRYNILNIEGFLTEHLVLSKSELRHRIIKTARESVTLYLPDLSNQRLIFIKPDYSKDELTNNELFIFNRQSYSGHLFTSSDWSIGHDLYTANQPSYETNGYEILNTIFLEF